MRYLFFTYRADNDLRVAHGNIWGEWGNFPSNKELKIIAEKRNQEMKILITGWQEFSNEEDFLNFTGNK